MTQSMIGDRLSSHDNNFATVRTIACLTVLVCHSCLVSIPDFITADHPHFLGFSPDWHAVHVFFILSGLLLTKTLLENRDPVYFLVSRFLRWVPAIVLAAFLVALFVGPLVTNAPLGDYFSNPATFKFIFSISTLSDVLAPLPGVFESNPYPNIIFEILWTMRYEVILSIILMIAFIAGILLHRTLLLAGAAAFLVFWLFWFWGGNHRVEFGSIHHLMRFSGAFTVGAALYLARDKVPLSGGLMIGLLAAAILSNHLPFGPFVGLLFLGYAVVFVGLVRAPWLSPFNTFGHASYGIYIYGHPIQQTISHTFPGIDPVSHAALSILITVPVAGLSWYFVEKHMLGYKKPLTRVVKSSVTAFGALRPTRSAAR